MSFLITIRGAINFDKYLSELDQQIDLECKRKPTHTAIFIDLKSLMTLLKGRCSAMVGYYITFASTALTKNFMQCMKDGREKCMHMFFEYISNSKIYDTNLKPKQQRSPCFMKTASPHPS